MQISIDSSSPASVACWWLMIKNVISTVRDAASNFYNERGQGCGKIAQ
jgi:hypothetical protein